MTSKVRPNITIVVIWILLVWTSHILNYFLLGAFCGYEGSNSQNFKLCFSKLKHSKEFQWHLHPSLARSIPDSLLHPLLQVRWFSVDSKNWFQAFKNLAGQKSLSQSWIASCGCCPYSRQTMECSVSRAFKGKGMAPSCSYFFPSALLFFTGVQGRTPITADFPFSLPWNTRFARVWWECK